MIPIRNDMESELETLRRKEKAFGLWQADALERIAALEVQNQLLMEDKLRRVNALNATRHILNSTAQMILTENFDFPVETLARDYAPFRNVMAHHDGGQPGKRRGKVKP